MRKNNIIDYQNPSQNLTITLNQKNIKPLLTVVSNHLLNTPILELNVPKIGASFFCYKK